MSMTENRPPWVAYPCTKTWVIGGKSAKRSLATAGRGLGLNHVQELFDRGRIILGSAGVQVPGVSDGSWASSVTTMEWDFHKGDLWVQASFADGGRASVVMSPADGFVYDAEEFSRSTRKLDFGEDHGDVENGKAYPLVKALIHVFLFADPADLTT